MFKEGGKKSRREMDEKERKERSREGSKVASKQARKKR